jgi:hypothetical protein
MNIERVAEVARLQATNPEVWRLQLQPLEWLQCKLTLQLSETL